MISTLTPLFPGVPGGIEMVVILLIAVLLFGANKIPKLARSTGQATAEFRKGRKEVEEELQQMEQDGDEDRDAKPSGDQVTEEERETRESEPTETEQ